MSEQEQREKTRPAIEEALLGSPLLTPAEKDAIATRLLARLGAL